MKKAGVFAPAFVFDQRKLLGVFILLGLRLSRNLFLVAALYEFLALLGEFLVENYYDCDDQKCADHAC